jgi:solute carrier family 25 iron transporter 28/37
MFLWCNVYTCVIKVVKQRLQVYNSPYKSCMDCIKQVYRTEGGSAFYRSYTTQLTMNVPFQSIHFMTYEIMQTWTNKERCYNPAAHMVSGAVAGAVAAAATTPLDVCKTLLNTQETAVSGLFQAAKAVYRLQGFGGYLRGMKARVLYQMPSTAISWSIYEFFKYMMKHKDSETEEPPVENENKKKSREDFAVFLQPSSTPAQITTIKSNPATAGLYGALAFKTVHNSDTTLPSSALLDISPISHN